MNNKLKNIISVILFAVLLFATSAICLFKPETAFSESERRPLAAKPEISTESIFSGEYMENFEKYTVDQFPLRDKFRTLKALFTTKVFAKMDNNGLFATNGHISKIEYPQNDEMLKIAAERFNYLYENYMKGKNQNIYLSIVPDKNFYLAKDSGHLAIDYEKFINDFRVLVPYMEYIDITGLLSRDDYYRTDSHWKQENITDVAELLAEKMSSSFSGEYTKVTVSDDFYGVYAGQSALPTNPDTLNYLTNDIIENCIVTYYDTGLPVTGEMYNMDKAAGKDPYEMFLSGTSSLITIENPNIRTNNELILFRDSFGSSIAPLLAQGYKKITVVDIRYVQSAFLKNFIDFNGQDVLFLYSTTLLNNSTALR